MTATVVGVLLMPMLGGGDVAVADEPPPSPTPQQCRLYGCLYVHRPPFVRPGSPQPEPAYGIARDLLVDGPDGRRFVEVLWPAGYDHNRRNMWNRVAHCESRGDWSINTGNGYYGGLQFSLQSWRYAGGHQYAAFPHHAAPAEQIAVAERLLQTPPYVRHWPVCGPRAGLQRR